MSGKPLSTAALVAGWHSLMPVRYEPAVRLGRNDFMLAAILAALAAALSMYLSSRLDARIYDETAGFDVWFQADPPRVINAMADSSSKFHYRTSVHPLSSLLTTPVVGVLRSFGVPVVMAGRALIAASGFFAAGFLLLALRGLGLPRAASALLVTVFLVSATYLNWFCLIETYAIGATSICLMLMVLTNVSSNRYWVWWVASAATLSVTVTDWALGITATFFRLGLRRTVVVTAAAFLAVCALSIYQKKALYPHSEYFFKIHAVLDERLYTTVHSSDDLRKWSPVENVRSILLTSAVAPPAQVVRGDQAGGRADQSILTNQHSPISSYSLADWIASVSWMILIILGIIGGWRDTDRRPVFFALLTFLLSQIGVYLFYGTITFLYAALFFPALVLLAGFGWFSRMRVVTVYAAAVFVVFGAIGNFAHFEEALRLANAVLRRN
jgi:hypothetical protein